MDPVTHTAIAFAIAQTGLKRLTKNWAWVMLVAGGAPDLDAVLFLPGNVNVLNWHRHFTHSLFFAPLVAAFVVAAVKYVLRREIDVKGAFLLALIGVVAHDLTDFLTFKGTRLLLPFTDRAFALQIESFVDPVLLLLLGLALAIPFLSNLVGGEIGAKRGSGAISAWMMLILSVCWLGGRYLLHEQAVREISSRIYEGAAPRRVEALAMVHPARFLGFVEGDDFKKILDVDLLDAFDPEAGEVLYRQVLSNEAGQALRRASATHTVQRFLAWSRWPHTSVTRYDGATRWVVVIEDLAVERERSKARVIVRMDERYAIQSEVYERSKGSTGF